MSNLQKEFIPYDLAVKLKALGFDEPCAACYYKKFDNEIGYHKVYRDFNFVQLTVSAPTFSQVFRWFREKGYDNSFKKMDYGIESNFTGYYYTIYNGNEVIHIHGADGRSKTYEEAELACLDKLIEIVENKSE